MSLDFDPYLSVQQLHPRDWQLIRALRLGALMESEEYFGSSYAASATRTESQWREWPGGPVFAGYVDDVPMGIVAAMFSTLMDGPVLISMWVAPWARGSGLATMLISRLVDWARERGEHTVYLEVAPQNSIARSCYWRYGFVEWDGPVLAEGDIPMRLDLAT